MPRIDPPSRMAAALLAAADVQMPANARGPGAPVAAL
jgi:hypothetical protein